MVEYEIMERVDVILPANEDDDYVCNGRVVLGAAMMGYYHAYGEHATNNQVLEWLNSAGSRFELGMILTRKERDADIAETLALLAHAEKAARHYTGLYAYVTDLLEAHVARQRHLFAELEGHPET